MGPLLFSPEGRINSPEFLRGAVILLAFNFFLWLSWYAGLGFGFLAAFISLVTIYCWACLFIKRFHDAGKSGVMFFPIFLVFAVGAYILANILMAFFMTPERLAELQVIQELDPANPEHTQQIILIFEQFSKDIVVPYAVAFFVTGSLIAFGTNARLQSDSDHNEYG